MVEIPTVAQLGARPLPQPAPQVQSGVSQAGAATELLGEAAVDIGRSIARFAKDREQRIRQRENFNSETRWMAAQTAIDSELANASREAFDAGTGAFDFADNQVGAIDQQARQFFDQLPEDTPPEEVERWNAIWGAKRNEVYQKARAFEDEENTRFYETQLTNLSGQAVQDVINNPDNYETVWNDYQRTLKASGLTPRQQEVMQRQTQGQFFLAVTQGLTLQNRFTEAEDFIEAHADALDLDGRAASSSNPIIERTAEIFQQKEGIKQSAATGGKHNIDERHWKMLLQEYRPDILEAYGDDDESILSLRDEPSLVKELFASEAERNTKVMDRLGIDPSPANLYLASIFGMSSDGGLAEILASSDEDELSAIVPPQIYAQNRELFEGKDVAWLKKYAGDLMQRGELGKRINTQNRLATGPAEIASARNNVQKLKNAHNDAMAADIKGRFQKAMALDPFSVTAQDILDQKLLRPGVQATLLNQLQTKQKEQRETLNVATLIRNHPQALDNYSKKHQDGVNEVWKEDVIAAQKLAQNEGREFSPQDSLELAIDLTKRTGIAPSDLIHNVRTGMLSDNPTEFAAAANIAYELQKAKPRAFEGQSGSKQLEKLAFDWRHYVEFRGFPPDRAASLLAPIYDPGQVEKRDLLVKEAKTITDKWTFNNVIEGFDENVLGDAAWKWRVQLGGGTPEEQNGFLADLKDYFDANYIDTRGNSELALNRAFEDMSKLYGNTSFGPPGSDFVRNPIELRYPEYEGKHYVIKDEMLELARARLPPEDVPKDREDIWLMPSTNTRLDIAEGRRPRYQIWYTKEENGHKVAEMLPGGHEFAPEKVDSEAFQMRAEKAFRDKQARERYVGLKEVYAEGEEDVVYDKVQDRFMRRNPDGTFVPMEGIDGLTYEELIPGSRFAVPPTFKGEDELSYQGSAPPDVVAGRQRTPAVGPGEEGAPISNVGRQMDLAQLTSGPTEVLRRRAQGGEAPQQGSLSQGVISQIVQVESGGDRFAKARTSSAYGVGQFISSTWMNMVRKYRPDLLKGRSKAQVLELRSNPALSRQMTELYAEENRQVLVKNRLPVNAANIYMLHFLGPTGGRNVLAAKANTPVSRLLPARSIRANRSILEGKTAGQVRAWAARKMN